MKNDVIHVGCGLDDYYLMPYGVLLVSLFETNKMNKFHIHIFSNSLSKKSIAILKGITDKYHADFTYYLMDSSLLENLAESDRISNITYSWNIMPEMIGPEVDKLLYLDGDMIVLDDIKPLWETDMSGCVIAAVDDIAAIKYKENVRLGIPERFGYFNTGTLLINNKEWIENDLSREVLTYAREHADILKFLDQDAGNCVLYNKRKVLHPKWNQQVAVYFLQRNFISSKYSGEVFEETFNRPVIVHFNGLEKPWEYANLHPFKSKFQYYLELSGVEKPKDRKPIRKIAKKMVYRTFGWGRWNRI